MLPATDLADLQDHCGRPFITRWQLVSGRTAGSRSREHCSGKFQFLAQNSSFVDDKVLNDPVPPSIVE